MNLTAKSLEVQWIVVGMKMPCLVSQSTTTKIASQTEDVGRVSMKSIEIEFHGRLGIGSCFNIHMAYGIGVLLACMLCRT